MNGSFAKEAIEQKRAANRERQARYRIRSKGGHAPKRQPGTKKGVVVSLRVELEFARKTLEGLKWQTKGHVYSIIQNALDHLDDLAKKRHKAEVEADD